MMSKKESNKELEIRAANTMQIASELQGIVSEIIENGGECNDTTMAALKAWQAALEVKAENIGHVKTRMDTDIEYYKLIEESARARRKTIESAQARLKKYLQDCMSVADVDKIKGELFTFSISKGRESVVITDESKLPFELVEIVELVKPKKDEIKTALAKGDVPGAMIERGQNYITIRAAGKKAKENDE